MRWIALLLISASVANAATVASDGTFADTQTKVYARAAGDTVTIPSGAFAWNSPLIITQAITLQGAGKTLTLITNTQVSGKLMVITLQGGAGVVGAPTISTRITGLGFYATGSGLDFISVEGSNEDNRTIRVDNCQWNEVPYWSGSFESCYGVADHNTIIGYPGGVPVFGFYFKGNYLNSGTTRTYGDAVWAAPDDFGTRNFMFLENNAYTNNYTTSELTMHDAVAGGRYVERYSIIVGGSHEAHGLEDTRERSMRAYECYMNTFIGFNVRSSPIYMRGGVGVIFSNSFSGWSASSVFSLLNNRSVAPMALPFGGSSGNNVWDVNNAGNPLVTCTASSAGTLTVTDNTKTWTTDQYKNFQVRRTSGIAIASGGITRSGTTVTVNTSTAHGLTSGDSISIWGANEPFFQNCNTAIGGAGITVTDSDTFTFVDVNSAAPTATGSGIMCAKGAYFAIINANNTSGQLTLAANFYGTFNDLTFAPGDTYEINQVTTSMDQPGRGQGADLAGAVNPSLPGGGIAQATSAWYEWDNYRSGNDVNFDQTRSGGAFATIVSGTHFNNNTQKPGYVPYVYPHPLVTGSGYNLIISGTMTVDTLEVQQ